VEEAHEAPGGYDHATSAQIDQPVECGDCKRMIPAGDWLWLLSQGELAEADEVKVLCPSCGEIAGCGPLEEEPEANNGNSGLKGDPDV
jgi:hypothetical protein